MSPWDNIHATALAALAARQPLWLVTLLAVDGSSFRRPGARALMSRDRTVAGCVAGHCAENQLRDIFGEADTELLILPDTGNIGCQGTLHVLVERLSVEAHQALFLQLEILCRHGLHALEIETHYHFEKGLALRVERTCRTCPTPVAPGKSVFEYLPGEGIHEIVTPPPSIALFAESGEAQSLLDLVRNLDWRVTLFTDDANPGLDETAVASSFARQSFDAAVIMTRRYGVDLRLAAQCLRSHCTYVGVVSSRQRAAMLATDLAENFPELTEAFERLHAPAGLNLGGDSPRSIALSIVSEIHACLLSGDGIHLRDGAGAIHRRGKSPGVSIS